MRPITCLALTIGILSIIPAYAQIEVTPWGVAVAPQPGDEVQVPLTIRNLTNQPITYNLTLSNRDLGIERQLHRDRHGGPDDMTYIYRDNLEEDGPEYEWIDIRDREGVVDVRNLADDAFYGMYELGFAFPYYGNEYREIGFHSNGFASFVPARDIVFYWPQWDRLPNANPGQADRTPPPTCMAVNYQDLNPAVQGHIYYWHNDHMAVVTWYDIPHFSDQQNQGPRWTFQLILTSDGLIRYQYHTIGRYDNETMMIGLQNEDRDMGFTVAYHEFDYLEEGRVIQFGPEAAWVNWVVPEPRSGVIEAGEEAEIQLNFQTDGEEGYYWAELVINVEDHPDWRVRLPIVMSLGVPVGNVRGLVIDAANDSPLEGAVVTILPLNYKVTTDEEGRYGVDNLPPRSYTFLAHWDDYIDAQSDAQLQANETIEVNFALRHATCNVRPRELVAEVQPEGETELDLTIANSGNAPLTYTIIKKLPPDAEREEWELRESIPATQILGDERIQGVVFAGDRFFLAGANVRPEGDGRNMIWVLSRDGEFIDSIPQPGEARYGMRDLTWDGELIWGSGERTVFGMTPEGEVRVRFDGPASPNQSITYDPDRNILWIAALTGNIFAYDREGNALGTFLNRRGLRLYSLDYFPEDPDRKNLYIAHSTGEGSAIIYKMDTQRGDTVRVAELRLEGGGSVESSFITGQYDIYAWTVMMVVSRARANGGDAVEVYQLASRKSWFDIEPSEGEVPPGEEEVLTVRFNGRGLPEVELEGNIEITHNGLGRRTVVPVHLSVIEGQVHTRRILNLVRGWNIVSLNIEPDNSEIPELTRPIVDPGYLVIIKDGVGRFYYPARGFNNIPRWSVEEGYILKVTQPCQLPVAGVTVRPDEPISLEEGWNLVAYFPRQPAPPQVALSRIRDHLIIVKDGLGRFWLPAWNFNNLPSMREGEGYMVKVDAEVELVYEWRGGQELFSTGEYFPQPSHFPCLEPTGEYMTLLALVSGVAKGEIAVLAGGVVRGSACIVNGVAGIAVWGDDPTTEKIDGAIEGEPLELKVWNGVEESTVKSGDLLYGSLTYTINGIAVIKIKEFTSPIPSALTLEAFPNPFNSRLWVDYTLPEEREVTISLLDLHGRLIGRWRRGIEPAGRHQWSYKADGISSGIYWLTLTAGDQKKTLKVSVVR